MAEPAISARRVRARASTSCCSARSRCAAPAACSSPTRSTRSSTTRTARRFTPAASCRSTRRPARHAEDAAPAGARRAAAAAGRSARSAARRRPRCASACRRATPRCWPRIFRRPTSSLDALNRFATPAQRRLIFEEAFLFQMGVLARRRSAAAERKPAPIHVDDRIRESARRVLPFKLTAGPEAGAEGDRRRPAAAAADEPAAAGRRRRRQDDRRAAGGARRDGERPAGGVHGADRDSGRAALREHLAAAAGVALPRRAADRLDGDAPRAASSSPRSKPARIHLVVGTHALVQGDVPLQAARPRRHRRAASLRRAAARDASRPKGCTPTCW